MVDAREKRSDTRPILKGSSAVYKKESALSFLSSWPAEKFPVIDLTRTNIEFRTNEKLPVGQKLAMLVRVPGCGGPAKLKAEVTSAWAEQRIGEHVYSHRVIAKLTGISSEAWDVFKRLEAKEAEKAGR
ncbi:MAG: hypothetical protein FJ279_01495 [Planctomycetes bacterium]|nr:hypothetical protein [Planctomycetota bacterium]MBM4082386.1 hypothetical protein [Planctomycetota bacterium]MBM4087148.1 hypothetical protein [Planctomycetota bacterium]